MMNYKTAKDKQEVLQVGLLLACRSGDATVSRSNIRTVMNATGGVVQTNNYYPFGLTMAISSGQGVQPYKYTGKELDMQHGLNLYDFSARTYDPAIGRFTTMDPLAEKYYSVSPYVYCANNPVNAVDRDGRSPLSIMRAYKAYKSYKAYRAYRAARTATVTMGTADAAMTGAAATATFAYTYNQFLSPEQAEKAQQSLLKGISDIANQNAAVSPGYNRQREEDRKAKEKLERWQANTANSIDTNISGNMPDGNPAPKRDPNDGGKGTKVGAIVVGIGLGAAAVESIVEGTQPQERDLQQPSKQPEIKPQESKQNNNWWQNFLNLFR